MRKPRVEEVRSLISLTDSGYFKLPEAKCVRRKRFAVCLDGGVDDKEPRYDR
jgi:hypothetical protein